MDKKRKVEGLLSLFATYNGDNKRTVGLYIQEKKKNTKQISCPYHRRGLHGSDGGGRPHGQKVVGAMPSSRCHENFMSVFEIGLCTDFELKMHQKCLAAGLCPDPLGIVYSDPQLP